MYRLQNFAKVWIDESGKIVRPNDVVFATDTYLKITGLESAKPLAAIRAWVRDETEPMTPAERPRSPDGSP